MNKTTALIVLTALGLASQLASAGDITGTISLKGTPPKEKDITPLKDDPTCGKLHTDMPTTHFYVVDSKGDHRIAMAFAILGLQVPGIAIAGAGAVAKTFPGFYDMLDDLRR